MSNRDIFGLATPGGYWDELPRAFSALAFLANEYYSDLLARVRGGLLENTTSALAFFEFALRAFPRSRFWGSALRGKDPFPFAGEGEKINSVYRLPGFKFRGLPGTGTERRGIYKMGPFA